VIAAALSVPDSFLHEAVAPCTDWSLEILPKHAESVRDLPEPIREIYVTMVLGTPWADVVAAVRTVHELGRSPIPHITARSIPDKNALEQLLLQFKEFGVERALLIGGGIPEPAGEFTSVLELLQSGLFEQHGLRDLDLAGHPEGNPDDPHAEQSLLDKLTWGRERGYRFRIVTQWCFDADAVNKWIARLRELGVTEPIHIGVPGPATMKTLMRFASLCGVKASATVLRKQGLHLTKLLFVNKPDKLVDAFRGHDQLHLFPFGGMDKASVWLEAWHRTHA
jgi:methylenetetrahydrofolate reductase (NADPH)